MSTRSLALCHEWTTAYGGSEQVAQRITEALRISEIYTFALDPQLGEVLWPTKRVRVAHPLGATTLARRHWQWLLPLMPRAWAALDLTAFDAVITSSHACVNAIRVRPGAHHICYCHTPIRYAWEWKEELPRLPRPLRAAWPLAARLLRSADRHWARRVTLYIANSDHVARRIQRCYGRGSVVVYPPIDTSFWTPADGAGKEDFFLFAGRLVAYKRADIAVHAAALARSRLVVAGSGPELKRLKRIAGRSVEFVEQPSRQALRELYRRARALVSPGVEDFGMTLVESQACGTPVIARRAGGATEAVRDGRTGELYPSLSPVDLAGAMKRFKPEIYSTDALRRHCEKFHHSRFDEALRRIVNAVVHDSVGVAPAHDLAKRAQHDLDVEG